MRALIVSIVLVVGVVICTALVAMFAPLDTGTAALSGIGALIFLVAALFATISALGPKSRPLPILTPVIAGMNAAAVMTVVVIVGISQFGQGHRATTQAGEPAKAPVLSADSPPTTPAEPAATLIPGVTIVPAAPPSFPPLAGSDTNNPPPDISEPAMPDPAPHLQPAEEPASEGESATSSSDQGATTAISAATPDEQTQPSNEASETFPAPDTTTTASEPNASPEIPIPHFLPNSSDPARWRYLSEDTFDTSEPPPLPDSSISNPPHPRSRPCGEGGPPCP